eukprot:TRINITY_DN2193_c0_g1_i2.p1 TRINITY_DN2193_c0_g1~~TRINITY_DN2193_c0_g1_i2.p1  ORF type:complete len:1157 (+),score=381.61 TRINITY_DN2193_c0_g1_i2:70-3471(+)
MAATPRRSSAVAGDASALPGSADSGDASLLSPLRADHGGPLMAPPRPSARAAQPPAGPPQPETPPSPLRRSVAEELRGRRYSPQRSGRGGEDVERLLAGELQREQRARAADRAEFERLLELAERRVREAEAGRAAAEAEAEQRFEEIARQCAAEAVHRAAREEELREAAGAADAARSAARRELALARERVERLSEQLAAQQRRTAQAMQEAAAVQLLAARLTDDAQEGALRSRFGLVAAELSSDEVAAEAAELLGPPATGSITYAAEVPASGWTGGTHTGCVRIVQSDGAGAAAGLEPGDTVLRLGDTAVTSASHLQVLASLLCRPYADISVRRGSAVLTFTLHAADDASGAGEAEAAPAQPEPGVTAAEALQVARLLGGLSELNADYKRHALRQDARADAERRRCTAAEAALGEERRRAAAAEARIAQLTLQAATEREEALRLAAAVARLTQERKLLILRLRRAQDAQRQQREAAVTAVDVDDATTAGGDARSAAAHAPLPDSQQGSPRSRQSAPPGSPAAGSAGPRDSPLGQQAPPTVSQQQVEAEWAQIMDTARVDTWVIADTGSDAPSFDADSDQEVDLAAAAEAAATAALLGAGSGGGLSSHHSATHMQQPQHQQGALQPPTILQQHHSQAAVPAQGSSARREPETPAAAHLHTAAAEASGKGSRKARPHTLRRGSALSSGKVSTRSPRRSPAATSLSPSARLSAAASPAAAPRRPGPGATPPSGGSGHHAGPALHPRPSSATVQLARHGTDLSRVSSRRSKQPTPTDVLNTLQGPLSRVIASLPPPSCKAMVDSALDRINARLAALLPRLELLNRGLGRLQGLRASPRDEGEDGAETERELGVLRKRVEWLQSQLKEWEDASGSPSNRLARDVLQLRQQNQDLEAREREREEEIAELRRANAGLRAGSNELLMQLDKECAERTEPVAQREAARLRTELREAQAVAELHQQREREWQRDCESLRATAASLRAQLDLQRSISASGRLRLAGPPSAAGGSSPAAGGSPPAPPQPQPALWDARQPRPCSGLSPLRPLPPGRAPPPHRAPPPPGAVQSMQGSPAPPLPPYTPPGPPHGLFPPPPAPQRVAEVEVVAHHNCFREMVLPVCPPPPPLRCAKVPPPPPPPQERRV